VLSGTEIQQNCLLYTKQCLKQKNMKMGSSEETFIETVLIQIQMSGTNNRDVEGLCTDRHLHWQMVRWSNGRRLTVMISCFSCAGWSTNKYFCELGNDPPGLFTLAFCHQ
jgi:hypothetical protein